MAKELARAGYTVIVKDNCHDAARFCLDSQELHAVVTEIALPYMWGIELARSASQWHPHAVIVALCTAEPRPAVKEELAMRGWQWASKQGPLYSTVVQKLSTGKTTRVVN
jgi:DNA-binding response OmpR family regulator